MDNIIAKRYVKALKAALDNSELKKCAHLFDKLSNAYKEREIKALFDNPHIDSSKKETILLNSLKSTKSKTIKNLITLLVLKNRIYLIPSIAEELRLELCKIEKRFQGKVFSNKKVDGKIIDSIAKSLSSNSGVTIDLKYIKSDNDGIKVSVDDLGLQIDLSKSRLDAQLVEHILKAI